MPTTLRKTKFHAPVPRPELVSRPRLLALLYTDLVGRHEFNRKLTLISAPAGFGKTTLIAEWLDGAKLATSFVSLDRQDNDPVKYWSCVIEALQAADPGLGKAFLSAIQSGESGAPKQPRKDLLTGLLNKLTELDTPIVLILDDYHLITNDMLHQELTFFLENLPRQLHLVIASRSDPPLPLARLRARGELTEIRQTNLKFNQAETLTLMNNLTGKEFATTDAGELAVRTEGWAAALQMVAVTLRGKKNMGQFIRSFSGSNRYILDYLSEEVFKALPEKQRRFLLYSSVLDHLSASLCREVTGFENCQALLEELDRNNLFVVPLDDERSWYRYHQLFADLLQHKLRQSEPELIPTLHDRAGRWYEANQYFEASLEHAFAAADHDRAALLLNKYIDKLWSRGRQGALLNWMQLLSPQVLEEQPKLKLYYAFLLIISGRLSEAEPLVAEVEQLLEENKKQLPEENLYAGMAATLRAFGATISGDSASIIPAAEKALKLLPDEQILWRGTAAIAGADAWGYRLELARATTAYQDALRIVGRDNNKDIYLSCSSKLTMNLWYRGKLNEVAKLSNSQLAFIEAEGLDRTGKAGGVYVLWGEVLREWNRLDEAMRLLRDSCSLGERENNNLLRAWAHTFLLRALYSRGELEELADVLDRMELWSRESAFPRYAAEQIWPFRAKVYLAGGGDNPAELARLVGKLNFSPERFYGFYNEEGVMTYCRLLYALGRQEEAWDILQQLINACEQTGRRGKQIEALVLLSMLLLQAGQTDQALQYLQQGLLLAEPEGYRRVFLDHGQAMAKLLYEAAGRGIVPQYTGNLLADFSAATESRQSGAGEQLLVEPLGEREMEILQLIAEGLSNKEIGKKLFLSLSTIKWHTGNIYGKLGVSRRTEAVSRARSLGILNDGKN